MSASIANANANSPRRPKVAAAPRTMFPLGHAEPGTDKIRLIRRLAPAGSTAPDSAAPASANVGRFELRSTVAYRVEGRCLSGVIIGISLGGSVRYDIRCLSRGHGKRGTATRVSHGVPHEDIEKLLVPPPDNQKIIVLSDLPPEPPAPVGQGAPRPEHKGFFAHLWRTERPR